MQPVITPAESARLDSAATEPVETLMERAGYSLAVAAARMGAAYGSRVICLAGPGNNGGDAYVAARHLKRRGVDAEVRSVGYPKGDFSPARKAAIAAVDAGVLVDPIGAPEPADLVIDAVFGAGFHGTLPPEVVPWTDHPAPVLAVDLPSGLSGLDGTATGPVFTADRTVTFHALKVGHLIGAGPDVCGEVEVVDIGLEGGDAELLLCGDADAPSPNRDRTAHKWSAGSVAVVGGSVGISGAAMLAAQSAQAAGAGSVRIITPGGLQPVYASLDAGIMSTGIGNGAQFESSDAGDVLAAAERFDVIALGPGLGAGMAEFVEEVVLKWSKPMVLDADCLPVLTPALLEARAAPTVITPHAGEFRALTGEEPSYTAARSLAENTGVVVVLKGNPTFVAGSDTWVVNTGGRELATIGTGDVLAGMIATYIAAGLDPEVAARSAAYRHGLAGWSLGLRTTVTASGLASEVGRWSQ